MEKLQILNSILNCQRDDLDDLECIDDNILLQSIQKIKHSKEDIFDYNILLYESFDIALQKAIIFNLEQKKSDNENLFDLENYEIATNFSNSEVNYLKDIETQNISVMSKIADKFNELTGFIIYY